MAVKLIMANWSIAQGLTFDQQLTGGIRYLDPRVQKAYSSVNFVHGLVESPITDLYDQVKSFYGRIENAKEVIILDFQHLYGFSDQHKTDFAAELQTQFADMLIAKSVGSDATLD
jgi:hypothetical protein